MRPGPLAALSLGDTIRLALAMPLRLSTAAPASRSNPLPLAKCSRFRAMTPSDRQSSSQTVGLMASGGRLARSRPKVASLELSPTEPTLPRAPMTSATMSVTPRHMRC
jgi:hypothetical protein